MIRVPGGHLSGARLVTIAAALVLTASAAPAQLLEGPHANGLDRRREALLSNAEGALKSGRVDEAAAALETATQMAHAADAELLQVRCLMQQGHYRQAASLAAHTAGDHREGLLPAALYTWLLALAGQESVGVQRLEAAMQAAAYGNAAPDPVALAVMRVINAPDTPVPAVLLVAPHRFAPYAVNLAGDAPSARAVAVAAGVLWDDGTRALVPMAAMTHARRIWVRNGLGQTVAAKYLQAVSGTDLAVLELAAPLSPGDAQWARRDPFAGSPGFVADYPAVMQAAPAWPRLRHGFLGGATLTSSLRRLGITLAVGSHGGAVFDKFGHVAGFAIAGMAGSAVLIPVSQLRSALGDSQSDARSQPADATVAFDEGYEQAMRMTLQVIAVT